MRREWDLDELIDAWTLLKPDWGLVGNKYGATRLGFAVILKFFQIEGRFPRHGGEIPPAALDYVAGQVKVGQRLALPILAQLARAYLLGQPAGQPLLIGAADRPEVPAEFAGYEFTGRTAEYHRAQIRDALGRGENAGVGASG